MMNLLIRSFWMRFTVKKYIVTQLWHELIELRRGGIDICKKQMRRQRRWRKGRNCCLVVEIEIFERESEEWRNMTWEGTRLRNKERSCEGLL